MKKKDLDKNFIKTNKDRIIEGCLKNAERKARDATILINDNSFATAQALQIIALEELVKAGLVESDFSAHPLDSIVDHKIKAIEVINLSASCYNTTPNRSDYDWAKKRIPEMREDCFYTKTVPTQFDMYSPNDQYWRKRAKSFQIFLAEALKHAKKKFK